MGPMTKQMRILILGILAVIIAAIFVAPQFFSAKAPKEEKFSVTQNPAEALKTATDEGKPVYLEFYGGT